MSQLIRRNDQLFVHVPVPTPSVREPIVDHPQAAPDGASSVAMPMDVPVWTSPTDVTKVLWVEPTTSRGPHPFRSDFVAPVERSYDAAVPVHSLSGHVSPTVSEAVWFMAASSPEHLAEAEGAAQDFVDIERMTERYVRATDLSDADLRVWSL